MISTERIKNQIEKAINALPTKIDLKRLKKTDEGYGGVIENEIYVATFNGFIDFASNKPQISVTINDAGSISEIKNITLIAVYESSFVIMKNDYFVFSGQKYRIRNSINQFDIYWQCELEAID